MCSHITLCNISDILTIVKQNKNKSNVSIAYMNLYQLSGTEGQAVQNPNDFFQGQWREICTLYPTSLQSSVTFLCPDTTAWSLYYRQAILYQSYWRTKLLLHWTFYNLNFLLLSQCYVTERKRKASYFSYNSIWFLIRMISAWYAPTITLPFLQKKQELIILREPLCIAVLFIAAMWDGARHL